MWVQKKHDNLKTQSCAIIKSEIKNKMHYIFRHNETILSLLPSRLGSFFLALLTHESTVNHLITNLMRLLFDLGLRVISFQNILKEL